MQYSISRCLSFVSLPFFVITCSELHIDFLSWRRCCHAKPLLKFFSGNKWHFLLNCLGSVFHCLMSLLCLSNSVYNNMPWTSHTFPYMPPRCHIVPLLQVNNYFLFLFLVTSDSSRYTTLAHYSISRCSSSVSLPLLAITCSELIIDFLPCHVIPLL